MRLFVAVWPPDGVVDGLRQLERPPLPGVRWTTEEQWHVTLRFLGDVEAGKVTLRQLAASTVAGPVVARAGPSLTRLGSTILCIPVEGLDGLAAAVAAVTADVGVPLPGRRFRGHLTLARSGPGRRLPPGGAPFSASWTVNEVTLVASTLLPHGARYAVVERVFL